MQPWLDFKINTNHPKNLYWEICYSDESSDDCPSLNGVMRLYTNNDKIIKLVLYRQFDSRIEIYFKNSTPIFIIEKYFIPKTSDFYLATQREKDFDKKTPKIVELKIPAQNIEEHIYILNWNKNNVEVFHKNDIWIYKHTFSKDRYIKIIEEAEKLIEQ